ncbi:efflux RND transporter periplasmic adaptor subunit [Roseateles oligotrophus]|uniref:Efflux RND transporter periplasmic adaptor subunit n=1 Tax=Roseateles oligotrophus TaxID=1769250 RepID=A0ABT2YGJ6_9BURK|nr:efflux RND transporter periplasmic adaptor subunit [Roseateles oligotrophus]MCV2369148.1 efflux RND transporter periplasmic adaptor subunit [Roseateles oligotrophus]
MTINIRKQKFSPGLTAMLIAAALQSPLRAAEPGIAAKARPALTVNLVIAEKSDWAQTLAANGSVAAWQEVVIGSEIGGLRLAEVEVNVGDSVKRGQLLARLSADTVQAELAQARAAASEARANVSAAKLDADRARELKSSGSDALSGQALQQYLTLELTADARYEAAAARVKTDELRLAQTRITAPDDGVISARIAAVGGVVQPGQELFRLIRKNRLEWRAEVPAAELMRLRPGMPVAVVGLDDQAIAGRLRITSPSVDAQTRMGLAYVDLPATAAGSAFRAGSFARGEFKLGSSSAISLPQTALQLRDGFAYVFQVGADGRVQQRKVTVGRRNGERVELTGGLESGARVVASGVGFLSDGDLVRVVDAAPAAPAVKPAKPVK